MNDDGLALRCEALEQRLRLMELSISFISVMSYVLAGLVLASVLICAFELRVIYRLVESQQWQSH